MYSLKRQNYGDTKRLAVAAKGGREGISRAQRIFKAVKIVYGTL